MKRKLTFNVPRVAIPAAILVLTLGAGAAGAQPKQTFFVPIDETHVRDLGLAITGAAGETTHSVVSISASADGTTLFYDHWEDGYEADPVNPVQASSELFSLDAGDFQILESDVVLNPRDPAVIAYDGRDRISTTELVAVTRGGWRLAESTLLAGAVEVFPENEWGQSFEFPLGEDIASSETFEYVAASIMAGSNGAIFDVDPDGDGTVNSTVTLQRGETILVTGIRTGGTLASSDPLQVELLTGDLGSTFASRWYSLVPTEIWGSSYYTPVSSVVGSENRIFLYNPGPSAITVTHETLVPSSVTRTYDNTTAASISDATPCAAPVVRTFSVPDTFTVAEARLGFNADHTYRGDIQVTLVAPSGTSRVVLPSDGGDGFDDYDLLLNDSSTNPINDGGNDATAAPFYDREARSGVSGLAPFTGEAANGTWTLQICDTFNGDDGTFNRAQLRLLEQTGSTFTTGTLSVPAGGFSEFTVPVSSAAHFFTTGGELFFATAAVDWADTSSDWGFTLLPEEALATTTFAGWATGRDPASVANPGENGSPIWVTAVAATDLYVDYDGDPSTGALVDPNGNRYDQLVAVGQLESVRLLDPADTDQSGTRVYTLDGTLIAAAWGQDAVNASPGAPGIDLGTTVLPLDALRARKDATLLDDADDDGVISPGDTILYTITITNISEAVVTGATVDDFGLDPNLTYVPGSTEIDGVDVPDDGVGATVFPLDEGGQPLADIGIEETVVVTFAVIIADPLPAGVEDLVNLVRVSTSSQIEVGSTLTTVVAPALAITKTSSAVGDLVAGQAVDYTVTVSNISGDAARGIKVRDPLPSGTAYVAESTVVSGFTDVFSGTLTVSDAPVGGIPFDEGSNPCGGTPLTRTFSVAQVTTIADLDLGFNAAHTFRGDIQTVLESPSGTRVTVLAGIADADDNYDVLLDDASPNPLDDGNPDNPAAPFYDRTAAPDNALAAFDGEPAAGTWTLEICDDAGGDSGTYNRAELRISGTNSTASTRANQAAAADPLLDGEPTDLVLAPDGFGLLAGQSMTVTYRVTVEDPLSPNTTAVTNTASVTSLEQREPLTATVVDPVTFGAALGDRVWLDVDGDGLQDIGEPGLGNVTVRLFDPGADGVPGGGDDVLVATAITDAAGNYLFDHLPAGSYYVDVDSGTVPAGLATSPGTTDPSPVVTLAAEEIRTDVDFGYTTADPATAILGDRIWSDADGDGVQDPGEPGVGGVTVELRDGSGAVVATAVTADDGSYLFTGVAPGEYRARVAPSNFGGGGPLDDYTVTQGPQSEGADISAPVTLAPGDVVTDVDFGYRNDAGTYSIRDAVWLDRDSDGVFDGDDSGIPGVTVNLLDASGDVVATAITAEDGGFSFDGVEPGDYTISVADNGGELIGLGGTTPPGVARSLAVAVVAADVVGENFGYNGDSLLGDRIWSDADGDGVQDPNESGLAGVTVELLDRSGAVIGSAVTDAFGNYVFDGIVPDQYSVRVVTATVPAGFIQTGDPDAALDGQGSALLDLGDAALDLDFGYRNPSLADVSGNVFADLDLDGVDDGAGEPGFLGVTVALLDASGNVIATTKTDGNGDYVFPDLPPGDYSVSVLDDQNVLADHRLTSGSDTLSVTLGATDITGLDFGYARDSATGVIGDRVWLDADGDGVQDGAETGLGGVTVELYDPGPDGAVGGGDDVLLATAVTDANGNYAFTGLAPGIYYAQMDTSTLPGGGADLVATTPDPTGLIPLSEGEIFPDADFGVGSAPGSGAIGDRVWFDADRDGVQDPGEVGIGGVGIELTGPGCAPCITVTAADGSYLFTGLAPGDYKVDFDPATLPALYDPAPTNTDGHWDVDGLTGGTVVTNADFGFSAAGAVGSIGDLVWNDLDGDGVLDPGEPGIGGVTIDLLDAAGTTVLASTTTAPDGSYDFLGLAAGTYQVRVTDTADVLSGLNLSAGTDPTGPIPLAAGQDYDDADFGYAPSGGAGSIGNLVWHDVDGDGARDPGEPGMEGITLDLWLDVDGNGVIEPGVDNRVRTTVTDANGEYVFNGLPDGDYLVDVTDAAGVLDGFTKTVGAPDTNDNSQADPYAVTVAGGSVEVADFGYRAGSNADILGTTFFDLDANGLEDGADFGVDQVEVFLFRDLDGDGALDPEDPRIGVTTVDANGDYIFEDLPPGDYLVAVDAGGTFVDGADQTTQLFTSSIQPVTLAAVDSTDNDFGFNRTATLALVVDVRRVRAEGRSFIVWSTAAESGTAGFRVHVGAEGAAVPLDPFMAAPLGAPQGADYRVEAPESVGPMVVQLEEIERSGASRLHGPFVLGLEVEEAETAGRDRRPALGLSVHGETFAASPRRPTLAGPDRSAPQALPRTGVTGDRLRLRVEKGGLAFVDLQTLAAGLGVDPAKVQGDLAAAALRLRRGSVDVAYLPVDGGLYFVGQPIEDQVYTSAEVYWLEPGRGVHMETVTTSPSAPTSGGTFDALVHLEENVFAGVSVARDPEVDYWHWKGVIAGHPTLGSAEVTLVAPDVDPSAPSRLRIRLRGAGTTVFEDEHHARFEVDGQEVGETRFDGLDDHIATVDLPPGALRDGAVLRIVGLLDTGAPRSFFYLDSVDIQFGRGRIARGGGLQGAFGGGTVTVDGFGSTGVAGFDLATPDRPRVIVDPLVDSGDPGIRYTFGGDGLGEVLVQEFATASAPRVEVDLPSDLRSGANAGTYLVIAPDALLVAAESLAQRREGDFGSSGVARLQDIFDEFADGRYHPPAIRDFLAHALTRWSEPPTHVTLMGTGTFDYQGRTGEGGNLLPPLLVGTPFGLYSSDLAYADVDGDLRPDVALGRIPAATPAEAEGYLQKLAIYEGSAGPWRREVLLLADDDDLGGPFSAEIAELTSLLPPALGVEVGYLAEDGAEGLRRRLFDAAARGVGWIDWMGHGGVDRLAEEGVLTVDDAVSLATEGRWPIFALLSCNVARFELPGFGSLAEALVLAPGGGIAVLAPSGLALDVDSFEANRLLAEEAWSGRHDTLGGVFQAVQRDYVDRARLASDVQVYQLLGDPALRLGVEPMAPATIFVDGFETGDLRAWSGVRD